MKIERYIPNTLTFANMFCGFYGIINVAYGDLATAGWLIFVAALFDLLDGLAARLLRVESKIGGQLDSFSDMVSFGLLPGILLVILLFKTHANWVSGLYFLNAPWLGVLAFLFPMATAYRLSRFNLAEGATHIFRGVPAPAAGLLVASLPLILEYDLLMIGYKSVYLTQYVLDPVLLLGIILLVPLLMVSKLPLFSLKFSGFQWAGNQVKISFILISLILFIFLFFAAVPVIFVLYILMSLIFKNQ